MSNETMPEKIWASYELDCSDFIIAHRAEEGTSYTRTDTIPDMTELQRQNAVLKKFARSIINEKCFGYDGEIDGASVQDQAANCGLITPSTVTREMIDEWERTDNYPSGDFEPGDAIYYFSDWLKDAAAKIPIPSRAQVAREFMDKASSLYCNTDASSLWQSMLRLHAEWEEAECQ